MVVQIGMITGGYPMFPYIEYIHNHIHPFDLGNLRSVKAPLV